MNTEQIIERVQRDLQDQQTICDQTVAGHIHRVMADMPDLCGQPLSSRQVLFDEVFNTLRRYDILQPLIDDDEISEIMVNGPDCIYIERSGKIESLNLTFGSAKRLDNLIQKIVASVNRTVNTASPIVDARLDDGSRVNVVLPPVAINGPILTIRKFKKHNFDLMELVRIGTLPADVAALLKDAVVSRKSIFIAGGTGSGKTTFLNALSACIPSEQRIISIEDSAELRLGHLPNWVRLETRNANSEGVGQITIKELIRTALRMRPDRVIVGEVRGDETIDMLQAMNTGHSGSLSTGHANSIGDMLKRLETMVFSAKNMPLESIKQQIGSAIDILLYLSRMADGSRKLIEVAALDDYSEQRYHLLPLYRLEGDGQC